MRIRILVVDDDEVTRKMLKEVFEKEGYEITLAASGEEAVRCLKREPFPIVVSDIRMVELDGMGVLRSAKKSDPDSSVILMTGFGSMEGAIEAIQQGAFDYVSKPFQIDEIRTVVSRAAKHWESVHGSRGARPVKLEVAAKGLIGKSPKIVEVYKILARAAMSSSTVLVIGESGTGKELVARAIHDNSQRRARRFVAVNCGALTESLLESELFGHVKGSFTGAIGDKRGLFEEASGGTLFLDEIGDITAALQIKLLRVLQENEIKSVGSNETRKVDVRVIAATHRDLETFVKAGKFREDLYYRLKVISIELRLCGAGWRISRIWWAIFSRASRRRTRKRFRTFRMKRWCCYVRTAGLVISASFEHAIERAVAMTNTTVLFPEDFPAEISRVGGASASPAVPSASGGVINSLEEMEKAHIVKVLQDVGFNKSKASEILGIDRATLYRKAQRYGIDLRGK